MKIGVLIGQVVQIGGVCIAAFEEVRNLRAVGHDAELVILQERPEFRFDDFAGDIPIRYISRELPAWARIDFKIPFFSFFRFFHLRSFFTAKKVIRDQEYDLLIVHETYNCFAALSLKKDRHIPFKVFLWDPASYILPRVYQNSFLGLFLPILFPLSLLLDKKIIKEAEEVIVCSDLHKKYIEGIGGRDKTKIVYPGCYPLEKLPEEKKQYLLALTKWDIGKNPFLLLDVLKILVDKNIKLIVAGNWVQEDYRLEFIDKIKQEGLVDRVGLIDRVDDLQKIQLFSGAIVLVHPIIEAFGMMCLEAAGCGCPSIIPKGSGVTNIFEHGTQGFFPTEGDINAYAGYINDLVADTALAAKMGNAAWEVAKQNTWVEHAKKILMQ
ncbi:MAG: glycosyltransferase family 4 protein [Patescibacteria group bacterium]|jgi:glycosyltransferase involved in cell wall biosynthesis